MNFFYIYLILRTGSVGMFVTYLIKNFLVNVHGRKSIHIFTFFCRKLFMIHEQNYTHILEGSSNLGYSKTSYKNKKNVLKMLFFSNFLNIQRKLSHVLRIRSFVCNLYKPVLFIDNEM